MISLGLDTTGDHCTVALVDAARILGMTSDNIGRGHAERLGPMVERLLKNTNCAPHNIDIISVCTGPGSFTGLRVALAFAKGFALPYAIPVIGLSALDIMAYEADADKTRYIIAVSDVRRGQLCWAAYDKGVTVQAPITQNAVVAQENIALHNFDDIVRDKPVNGAVLAWAAMGKTTNDYPATAFYSRAPDAKRPTQKPVIVSALL